jgi:hypothetical protein
MFVGSPQALIDASGVGHLVEVVRDVPAIQLIASVILKVNV